MKLYGIFEMSLDEWRLHPIRPLDVLIPVQDMPSCWLDYPNLRPPGWFQQESWLDAVVQRWPDGEFLHFLVSLYGMCQGEWKSCSRAISAGKLAGERTPYGYIVSDVSLQAWIADHRSGAKWRSAAAQVRPYDLQHNHASEQALSYTPVSRHSA